MKTSVLRIKEVFMEMYYSAANDFKVVRKILESGTFDSESIVELELINVFYHLFMRIIAAEKADEIAFESEME